MGNSRITEPRLTCSRAEKASGRRRLSKRVVAVRFEINVEIIQYYLNRTAIIMSDMQRERQNSTRVLLANLGCVSKLIVQLIDIALLLRRARWCGLWMPVCPLTLLREFVDPCKSACAKFT